MNKFLSIEQEKLRDEILYIKSTDYLYGVANFNNLNLNQFKQLLVNGFIQLDYSY